MYHSEEGAGKEPHSIQSLLDSSILITIHNFTIFHQSYEFLLKMSNTNTATPCSRKGVPVFEVNTPPDV